jgi:hypothetical protein
MNIGYFFLKEAHLKAIREDMGDQPGVRNFPLSFRTGCLVRISENKLSVTPLSCMKSL